MGALRSKAATCKSFAQSDQALSTLATSASPCAGAKSPPRLKGVHAHLYLTLRAFATIKEKHIFSCQLPKVKLTKQTDPRGHPNT